MGSARNGKIVSPNTSERMEPAWEDAQERTNAFSKAIRTAATRSIREAKRREARKGVERLPVRFLVSFPFFLFFFGLGAHGRRTGAPCARATSCGGHACGSSRTSWSGTFL